MFQAGANPPFRAEHIGSLLHSDALIQGREAHLAGRLVASELRALEDQAIRDIVALQERTGLAIVTDGELRRGTYLDFAISGVTGVRMEWTAEDEGVSYRNSAGDVKTPRPHPRVHERIRNISTSDRDFAFLCSITDRAAKMTLAGPCFLHFAAGRKNISREVYPTLDSFWADIVTAYDEELRKLHAAGCRYVQLDETSIAKFADQRTQDWLAARGDDWKDLLAQYTDVINAVVARAPAGMQMALHLCRGNNRGTWQAEGGYDAISESLFRKLDIDLFLLEFDTPRAGSFAPLKMLPDHKAVVLGLLSTKRCEAEAVDAVMVRLCEASAYVPMERLAVSPQCGFWGGINLCTFAELEAKLSRVVEVSRLAWKE